MPDTERRLAAKQFASDWADRGDEKQETQSFWLSLLQKVYDVAEPEKFISFEKTVTVDDAKTGRGTTKFIDGYIGATRVLIEQKAQRSISIRARCSPTALSSPRISRHGATAAICPPISSPAGSWCAISGSSVSTT